jgi:hypothetical protein
VNLELEKIIKETGLDRNALLKFAYLCVSRVSDLLENEDAIRAYKLFNLYLNGEVTEVEFVKLAEEIKVVASSHQGSNSIDGSKHSAVSATYALANAINAKVVEAANYAAYSKIYGYGGYAVNDPDSFKEEYAEQVKLLQGFL